MATFQRRLELAGSLQTDGSRRFVHPADVHGRFTRLRWVCFVALVALWAVLPWWRIGGNPAVFLDVGRRRFFLFGQTFNAQDVWLVFFLLTGAGFTLIALTAVLGRVWCGYACPQTVFLEGVYRRIERWIEGARDARMRRDRGPWTPARIGRKAVKHAAFAVVSVLVAHIFVSYFVSLPGLWTMMRSSPAAHPEAFVWMASFSIITYLNFAWFREQICLILCPYGRLQSVLTDDASIVIGYDTRRGEPRGKMGESGHGDCIDCNRCVVVCPTAIDIRQGLQLECVGCAACVDACDEIMDKVGRPRGLVRYDSLDGLEGRPRRFWRPRLALYGLLGLCGLAAAGWAFTGRSALEVHLVRARGAPFTVDGGVVQNVFDLHVVNRSPASERFRVRPRGPAGSEVVVALPEVALRSLEGAHVPIVIRTPIARLRPGLRVELEVAGAAEDGPRERVQAPLLGPRRSPP